MKSKYQNGTFINGNILGKQILPKTTTDSGIILSNSEQTLAASESFFKAEVLCVAPEVTKVKIGDIVILPYAYPIAWIEGDCVYARFKEPEIIAIL